MITPSRRAPTVRQQIPAKAGNAEGSGSQRARPPDRSTPLPASE